MNHNKRTSNWNKNVRRPIALAMAVMMCVSLMSVSALAEEDVSESEGEPLQITTDAASAVVSEDEDEEVTEIVISEPEEAEPAEAETAAELETVAEPEEAGEAEGPEEPAEAEPEEVIYTAKSDFISVKVTAPADALPDDAELKVERYAEDSSEYRDAAEAIDLDEESGMAALDISFLVAGEEVEPTEPVKVSIDVSEILPEDADASTLEVQHLKEGRGGKTNAVIVANESEEIEGTIDEEKATAEFEVESFSEFTVTWSPQTGGAQGNSYSVSVTAYLEGVELNGISNVIFTSENDELNFETLLSDVGYGTGDYTFSYAIATVGNTSYGTQNNPIVAIEIETATGGGPTSSGNFVFVYMDGTSNTVSISSTVSVEAYYLTPDFSVSIEAVDEDAAEGWLLQAVLSHAGTYDHVGYEWTITNKDGSSDTYATIGFSDTTGRVFIVWADGVEDNTEITVSVTATLYDSENNVLGTATDSYDLEYGDETVDLIMTYGPDKTQLPAGVEVTLTNTVTGKDYTGTTDNTGWVHDVEIEPGIYIVTATYTDSNGATYMCNETVAMHDAGNYSVNLNYYDESILTNVTDRDNWEHIDIKLSVGTASTDASNENVSVDITKVVIYDGTTGAAKYTATEDSIERNDNEFQCSFYDGDGTTGTASHSVSFSTSDTIEITYSLTWTSDDDPDYSRTETFTLTIDASTVYSSGTTYPATGQRAYKLYNYLYGTSYSSDAQLVADGIDSVDIGGMSMMLVASILCDSSDVTGAGRVVAADGTGNQWGMDFAVSIDTFIELSTNWMFDIEKTYENHSMNESDFTFYMYSANYDESTGYWHIETDDEGGWHYTLGNSTAGQGIDGNSSDTIENVYITFDDEMVRRNATHYYIICEDTGDLAYTTYDSTVFGAAVYVGVDETTDEPVVTATYYILTSNGDGTYTAEQYSGEKITTDGESNPTFHFTNVYQTGVQIHKQDMSGNGIDATFTLTQEITDSEGTTTYYYYDPSQYKEDDPDNSVWVEYTPGDSDVTIAQFTLGDIDLGTPWDGTYTFTEVSAPTNYKALPDAVVVTVENGLLKSAAWASSETTESIDDFVSIDSSGLNLYLSDEAATGSVTLSVDKSISGVSSTDKTFSFTLYNSDENFTTGESIETITTDGTITDSTQLNFTAIPYTKSGTYYYVITETGTAPDGWTLDTKEYHVTVTVTDNGDGTLTTSALYAYTNEEGETQTENNAASFTNTYKATGELALTGTKTLVGGTLEENSFSFTMTDSTGESVGDVTMDADGNITFPTMTYDESDIGGKYTYTIVENEIHRGTFSEQIQYDKTEYTVVVSVADNGDGTLDVTYTVTADDEESDDITFTNYQKGSLTISKTFTGLTKDQIASLTDFTITVTNSDGDTVATLTLDDADEDSSYTWTVSNLVADTYTVTESGYSLDGYEVIAKSGEVKLKTDGSAASVADELTWGDEASVEFINDYTEVGTITVSKYVTAEEDIQKAHVDTEYTVVITASDDVDLQWVTISIDGEDVTDSAKIDSDAGTITFTIKEDETATINGLPAGGYTVEEQGTSAMTSEHCVPSYRIGDQETETAPTVAVASGDDNVVSIEIDNEYPIGTYIQVKKDYNKDEYPTGDEAFTFTIEALTADLEDGDTLSASEMPMPTNSTVTVTSEDGGYMGIITFDDEENEFEHFGTYYYKITETKGSLENVDYDESVHYVKVVVAFDDETHVLTTDEWEARADAETDDYKNLEYTEAGIVTAEFTNTAYDELTIEKEVAGNPGDTSEYEFEITLTKDGEGYTGDIETTDADPDEESNANFLSGIANWFSGIVKVFADDEADTITFTDGKATVTIAAGESITLLIPSGWDVTITEITTGADTTTVYRDGKVIVQAKGTTTEATADLGTVADSTQVKFVNSYREYFPIDEEIVTDTDDIFDRDAWVKNESVNEYNAIEIEMTTNLPVVTAYDLANGEFTMNFHEVLDSHLNLDEDSGDFSVYIAGTAISTVYYRITFDDDTGDDCNFHVDVDLTALYNDGIVTDDMLDGNTEITIFFFADLEGTDLNGSYTSTIWYDIYDGDEWLYTSNESVVAVYTYEIEIQKYDEETNAALAGAEFGVYYDEGCTEPVYRYVGQGFDESEKKAYTVTSDADGVAMFYGLAEGTYYVKELKAPSHYVLSDEILEIELGEELNDSGHVYQTEFANTPATIPEKKIDIDGDLDFNDDGVMLEAGTEVTYQIEYYNYYDEPMTVTIKDTLDKALDFVSASDGGVYDADSRTVTWTIENAEGQKWGAVTFTAKVNDQVMTEAEVDNTASVQIGNDDAMITNKVENPTPITEVISNPIPVTGAPKTSDTNNITLWLTLLVAAMACMLVGFRMRKQS